MPDDIKELTAPDFAQIEAEAGAETASALWRIFHTLSQEIDVRQRQIRILETVRSDNWIDYIGGF